MASGWFTQGLKKLLDGTIDIDTSTLKIILVDSGYTFNADHDVIDNGANDATDPSFNEIVATNYTGGYAGAGRKTASVTLQVNDTDNRVDIAIGDLTWTSLGGASNDTPAAAILAFETGGADTTTVPIAYLDFTDTPTNGGNFTLDFATLAAGGNLQIAV